MTDNLESGILEGFKEAIKAKPAITVVVLFIMVACGLLSCGEGLYIFTHAPITATIVKRLNNPGQSANQPSGFIPFTTGDCNVPGDFPAPDATQLNIYPTNIYCPFMPNGTVSGVIYLSVDYEPDLTNSPFASYQQGWKAKYQDLEKINSGTNYIFIDTPPTQETIIVVSKSHGFNGDAINGDIADLRLYKGHFIIEVTGNLNISSGADAQEADNLLIQYAMSLADRHYK